MSNNISVLRKLERDGYLSLNQFIQFLELHAPEAKVSYPTARRLIKDGKLRAVMHGSQYRVRRTEVERWIAEGNWEGHAASPYSLSLIHI